MVRPFPKQKQRVEFRMSAPVKLTPAEQLLAGFTAEYNHLSHLTWPEVATNLGLTAAVVVIGALLVWAVRRGTCSLMRIIPGLSHGERKARASRALGITRGVALVIVIIGALFLAAEIWGFDPLGWTQTAWGAALSTAASRVLVVLVVTAVALEAATLMLEYFLGRLKSRTRDPRREAQLNTLGPIFRSGFQIAIVILAAMTLLGQVGVQIAPILTGAGVVGIAVGFGAQTLVKDFFTGFFLIIEDIVAVGDVVQIQAFSGTVEEMTLRTIRLRDFDGTLHIFPYGEAQIIHNMTKTYSYSAFDLPVKIDTDIDKAMAVMRQAFEDLRGDPAFANLILDDIDISGIDLLSDVGVILKGRIRTRPADRWTVLREYLRRVKRRFDEAGIVLTHK
jgi:small conductance mechanosensitive channel